MKKLTILAALLMATTSAHAGNSISLEVGGHKIRIETPKNCDQLSCVKISGFDFKSFNSKRFDDDGAAGLGSHTAAERKVSARRTGLSRRCRQRDCKEKSSSPVTALPSSGPCTLRRLSGPRRCRA